MAKAEKAQHGTTYEIPDTPECRAMENLLGKTLKCTLDDGRTAIGDLVCIDRLKNIILKDAVEERWVDSTVYNSTSGNVVVAKRSLSQAMIPGKHLVKVEISQDLYKEHVEPILSSVE